MSLRRSSSHSTSSPTYRVNIPRGFELTSIKAAYVIERLNEVFSTCGIGWRYVHAPFEFIDGEVLTEVALQYAVTKCGTHAVVWQDGGWPGTHYHAIPV